MRIRINSRSYAGGDGNYCSASLYLKDGLSSTLKATKSVNCKTVGEEYDYKYADVGAGSAKYYFSNIYIP